ncbi:hypothetical protein Pfo_023666 [Paulownia fortunei]|nr:hypothetical protein Pfo_023666 [Paulownia fortunei]
MPSGSCFVGVGGGEALRGTSQAVGAAAGAEAEAALFPRRTAQIPEEKGARRVRSGIQMSAKDRLESLMLARRSASDLSIMKPPSMALEEEKKGISENGGSEGGVRVRMRLPKAEVERLMAESKDGAEVAEKIVSLCMANSAVTNGGEAAGQNVHWNGDHGVVKRGIKSREKRVGFLPINEGDIHLAVAS